MDYVIETYFQWPVLPFSILMLMTFSYWLLVIMTGLDIDVFDFDLELDLDLDPDISPSVTDLGMLGLKWLNLGEIPFMIWISFVVFCSWLITMILDRGQPDITTGQTAIAIGRALGLGIIATKLLTNPMRGKFRIKQPNTVAEMIGRTCSIVTNQATTEYGNAVCEVEEGAPLRLNVRTVEGTVQKNAIVKIVDYSEETGIYYVEDTGNRLT